MRVAVVVPAYNAARHLEGVVQRILAAPPSDLERIVVVDDGSRDDDGTLARALAARHAGARRSSSGRPTAATAPR